MNDRIIRNKKVKKNEIDIITMGCSKNLVDSELLMKQFEANGYHCVHDSKRPQGEIAVINTCGFIEDAKQESIDMHSIAETAMKNGNSKFNAILAVVQQ